MINYIFYIKIKMEEIDIIPIIAKGGEYIHENREYEIKHENDKYILRIDIDESNISFILSSKKNKEYNYKIQMKLSKIITCLKLDSIQYSKPGSILKFFDEINTNQKFFINKIDNGLCKLEIKYINNLIEEKYEFKLAKNFADVNDKLNMVFNIIKSLENKEQIEKMNNKINELEKKVEEKDKEIKDIIKEKEEMNNIILNQENKIKELENKNNELLNLIDNDIKKIKNKNIILDIAINEKNDKINETINNYHNMKTEIEKLIKNQEDYNNENDIKIAFINNHIGNIENRIDFQYKQQNEFNEKIKKIIGEYEYDKKIKNEFFKEPFNLKFKTNITTKSDIFGCNDVIELFVSYKDNDEYLVFPNIDNNLDILRLIDNKKITQLKGHNNKITTVRYFINNNNKNEYLISGDNDKKVIIWDLTNNYNSIANIDTKYNNFIDSCLLVFPKYISNSYIIISTRNISKNIEDSATKVYLFNDITKPIKYINNSNKYPVFYLLDWYNRNNNSYYIVQLTYKKIVINNLLEDEIYCELTNEPESNHLSGFIYNQNNNDYLCTSSDIGLINIWDLNNKSIYKIIKTNVSLAHIIEWNKKYIIAADFNNKSIKIIDKDNKNNNFIIDIKTGHDGQLPCIKKIKHPIYGEALITAGYDKTIKLWTME